MLVQLAALLVEASARRYVWSLLSFERAMSAMGGQRRDAMSFSMLTACLDSVTSLSCQPRFTASTSLLHIVMTAAVAYSELKHEQDCVCATHSRLLSLFL
mmetsp:Transcript_19018/g.48562  ORF Transcript_19018/g.48562 Transcript_19018/m.48562 type:complete len:100 (-) Transcript_19018:2135-2434(-)